MDYKEFNDRVNQIKRAESAGRDDAARLQYLDLQEEALNPEQRSIVLMGLATNRIRVHDPETAKQILSIVNLQDASDAVQGSCGI